MEGGTVLKSVEHVDVEADRGVIVFGLPHKPPDTVQRIIILRPFYRGVSTEESRILGVVAIVLPADQINDLLKTWSHGIHPLYGLQSLFASHIDCTFAVVTHLIGSHVLFVKLRLAKEQLGHQDFGIVIPWSDVPLKRSLFEKKCVRLSLRQEHIDGLFRLTTLAAGQEHYPGHGRKKSDHLEGHNRQILNTQKYCFLIELPLYIKFVLT